jgi:T4 RnlA family RNA ligase
MNDKLQFPKGITLQETLEAIRHNDAFKTYKTREGFTFVKYHSNDPDTFPDLNSAKDDQELRRFQILRECRGITFDAKGTCIARRFHKFFNINEREETDCDKLDWDRPFYLIEKLDGSLVSPLLVGKDILFTTMAGFTEFTTSVDKYLLYAKVIKYTEFCKEMIKLGKTPLFEWCHSENPQVINYPRSHLTLLNIRDIDTGIYMKFDEIEKYSETYKIPLARRKDTKKKGLELVEEIYQEKQIEGYVIVFEDTGEMYKCKTYFYMCAHGLFPQARNLNSRLLLQAVCQNCLDDILSTVKFSPQKKHTILFWAKDANDRITGKAKKLSDLLSKDDKTDLELQLADFASIKNIKDPDELIRAFLTHKCLKEKNHDCLEWLGLKDINKK